MKKTVAVPYVDIENEKLGFFGFCKQVMGFDTLASISSSYLIQILITIIEWEITKSTHQPDAAAQYAEQLRNYSSQVKEHLDTLELTLTQLPDAAKLQAHLSTCKGSLMAQLNFIQASQGQNAATQYLEICKKSLAEGHRSLGYNLYLRQAEILGICSPPPTHFIQWRLVNDKPTLYSVPSPYVPDSRCPKVSITPPSIPDTPIIENSVEDLRTAFDKLNSAKEAQVAFDTTLKSEGSQLFSLAQYTLQLSLPKVTGVTVLTRLVLDMVVMPIVIRVCYLKGYTPQQTSELLRWVPVVTGPVSQMLAFLLRGPLGLSVDSSQYQQDIESGDQSAKDLYVTAGSALDGVQNAQQSTRKDVDLVNRFVDTYPSQVVAAVDEVQSQVNNALSDGVRALFVSEVDTDLDRTLIPTYSILFSCSTPINHSNTQFRNNCIQEINTLRFDVPFQGPKLANMTACSNLNAPEDIRIEMPTAPTDPTTPASLGFDLHSTIGSALGLALAELGAMYLFPVIFGPLTFAVLTLFQIETAHSILGAKNGPLTVLRNVCSDTWQRARRFCCPTHTPTVQPAPPSTVHRNLAFEPAPSDMHVIQIQPEQDESPLIRSEATLSTVTDYLEAKDLIRGLIKKAAEKTAFIKIDDYKESARRFEDPNGEIQFWISYLDYRYAMNKFSPMCNPLNTFMEFVENVATGIVKLPPKSTTYLWLNYGTIIRDLALQTPEGRSKEGFTRLMNHDSLALNQPHPGYKESGC